MRYLVVGGWLLVTVIGSALASDAAAGADGQLRVATFCSDATPPLGSPTYPSGKPLETVETPLLAKGIVLDDGRQRIVLCVIDWCGLCGPAHSLVRQKLAAGAGTDVSQVTVHTVHQHTAPYVPIDASEPQGQAGKTAAAAPGPIVQQMAERLSAAVKESLGRLQPFNAIGFGQARVDRVASARRILAKDGTIRTRWSACKEPDLRAEPEGRIDPVIKTITLARDEKPLVRLHYYATHPQSFYGDARVCYDVPGFARERLEAKEQVFQVYFTGCAGDVVMGKYNDGTPQARSELSDRLYAGMEASVAATRLVPVDRIVWRTLPVVFPLKEEAKYDMAKDRAVVEAAGTPDQERTQAARRLALVEWLSRPLSLSLLRMGPVDLVHLPGESLIEYQLFAQKQKPDRFVVVAAYGDLATGYICTEQAFSQGGYEPGASHVAPRSEGIFKEAISKLLELN